MPYGIATWDEALYGCPKRAGHSVEHRSPVLASEGFYSERVRLLVGRDRSSLVEIEVPQTAAQWSAFLDFYLNTLDDGQAWFNLDLRIPGGIESGVGHIDSFAVRPIGRHFDHALLRATVEWYG